MISGSDAASIFMEPIHLSSAIAAKKIINEGEEASYLKSTTHRPTLPELKLHLGLVQALLLLLGRDLFTVMSPFGSSLNLKSSNLLN